jgi:hypothetical protein
MHSLKKNEASFGSSAWALWFEPNNDDVKIMARVCFFEYLIQDLPEGKEWVHWG